MNVRSGTSYHSVSRTNVTHAAICVLAIVSLGICLAAQTLPDPRSASSAENPIADRNTGSDDANPFASVSRVSLSANQIIALLQERPQITIELKSLLAETQQQQGSQVQPDDITDEMLYSQINSNKELLPAPFFPTTAEIFTLTEWELLVTLKKSSGNKCDFLIEVILSVEFLNS